MAFIHVNKIRFAYKSGSDVFSDFSSTLLQGRVVGLLGPSGTGKTTLLRLISELETPTDGEIAFDSVSPIVTFVPQDPVLFEHYSRYENAIYRSRRGAYRQMFNMTRFKHLAHVLSLDEGFLDNRRPLPGMSGGQRQRLILLRELSIAPDLLLLDEPCTGLDPAVKREFLLLLAELLQELNVRCIYTTHHFDELLPLADEIMYLSRPRDGPCEGVIQPLKDFLLCPPTTDAAVAVFGPLSTILTGQTRADSDSVRCRFVLSQSESSDTLVIPINSVQTSQAGMEGNILFQSGHITLLSVCGQRLTAQSQYASGSVTVNGDGYLFSKTGFTRKVNIETVRRDTEWLLVLTPQ
jgi:ABC-type Fe3+/spermidine/putrescine transport system ATPase subunit